MGWQKELMEAVESDDYDWVRDIMDDERSRQKSLAKQEGRVLEDLCIPHVVRKNSSRESLDHDYQYARTRIISLVLFQHDLGCHERPDEDPLLLHRRVRRPHGPGVRVRPPLTQ